MNSIIDFKTQEIPYSLKSDYFGRLPQLILYISDEELGLLGYLVIDRIPENNPTAIGGVRMREGLTIEEVADLAREMTLKFAFLNIPVGGAKAAVIWRPLSSDEERKRLFTAFGKSLGPLLTKGIYCAGEDMGITSIDLYHIKKGAGIKVNQPKTITGISGYYTGLSVYICAEQLASSLGMDIKEARVAIEGFGKVGASAAKLFDDAGAKVVAVSTIKGGIYNPQGLNINKMIAITKDKGDDVVNVYSDAECIPKESLLSIDVDILIPSAGPYTITERNLPQLKSKMVVPGANIPATAVAESLMYEKGIYYMPSFVSNGGAILAYALIEHGFRGFDLETIMKKGFGKKISELIEISQRESLSLCQKAREIAEKNMDKAVSFEGGEQYNEMRKYLGRLLWRLYKMSFRIRASSFLKSFAINYMENELLKESPDWSRL